LESLQKSITPKRDHLLAQLADKKSISSSDEYWLDNDANLVKEVSVLEALDEASDYERGVERLDDEGKAVVMKLMDAFKNCKKNCEATSGDDDDDSSLVKPCPTTAEALQALDNPISCKLEGVLASFSCQISLEQSRAKKDMAITNYFDPV
jgi:hypothetical protein